MSRTVRVESPERSPSSSGASTLDASQERELTAAAESLATNVRVHVQEPEEPPYHVFSKARITAVVALVTLAATFSPMSTSIYFPAQNDISQRLNISTETVNLSITTYLIAQALAPSFWGPIADVIGRRQVLIYTLILYTGANIGLALAQNATMLLVFRFIQAWGSSSTISVGAGVIADLTEPSKRGSYMGWFAGTRQWSTALAPVLGGLLGGYLGFRSIFWFLTILAVVAIVIIILFLPETQRRLAGNGSVQLKSWKHKAFAESCISRKKVVVKDPESIEEAEKLGLSPTEPAPKISWRSFFEPMRFLCEKDVACALFFGACVYTSWSMVTATTSILLKDRYEFNTMQIGFCFLANGFGCMLGSIYSGKALDANFRREGSLWQYETSVRWGTALPRKSIPLDFPLERARLFDVPLYSVTCMCALLMYGWSLMPFHGERNLNNVHVIVPLLAQFILGFAATAVLNGNNTLTIDLWPQKSASATAINNFARCAMGAVGVSVAELILKKIGPGGMCSVLAGLVLVGTLPIFAQWINGKRWRAERHSRIQSRIASRQASRCPSPGPGRRRTLGSFAGPLVEKFTSTKASRSPSECPPIVVEQVPDHDSRGRDTLKP